MLPADLAGKIWRQLRAPLLQRLPAAGRNSLLLPVMLLLPSCVSGPAAEQVCHGRQIVIGFTPGVEAARPATAAGLSQDAGVTISYMRHLFDHYSLYCAGPADGLPVTEAALQRLRKRPDILSVQTDAVRHPLTENTR